MSLQQVSLLVLSCLTSATVADRHRHTPSSCTRQTVRIRPDNYLRCLLHFGQCVNGVGPYDHGYYNALRRNVADSCREFMARPDVLPAVRRTVYDASNLYLQRIGQTVYRHEIGAEAKRVAVAASAESFPPVRRFIAAVTNVALYWSYS